MIEMSKLREIATRDEGREEGREEGRLEGLEKGMKETQKKIAINLLQSDMPLDRIKKMTGLGLEQLRELEKIMANRWIFLGLKNIFTNIRTIYCNDVE